MSVEVITSIDQYLKFIFLAYKSQRSSGLLHIFWCLSSIIFLIFVFFLKNHWVIGSNLDVMLLGWSSYKILYDELAQHPNWLSWLLIGWKILVFENPFSSEFRTIGRNETKFSPNSSWEVPFQNCVHSVLSIIKDGHHGWLFIF